MSTPPDDTRVGVTALTGFLGSGKTTLLNRLVAEPGLRRSLVIVNELGEIGVDHHLIRVLQEDVVLLPGGCVCCSLRGGLADTLRDRFMLALQGRGERFDRVLIETSGVADPSPILFTLRHDPFLSQRYRYDHTLTLADAQHVLEQLARHPEVARQLALADTLIVSKTDLCQAPRLAEVGAALTAINPMATQFGITASGALPRDLLERVGAIRSSADRQAAAGGVGDAQTPVPWRDWPRRFSRLPAARHTAGVGSFIVPLPLGLPRSRFYAEIETFLADFGSRLLRMKGLVDLAGQSRPAVAHAVHTELYPLGWLARWPGDSPDPSLVCVIQGDRDGQAERAAHHLFQD